MTQPFGHGKLIVYQKAMRFAALRGALLDRLPRRVAACEHIDRAASANGAADASQVESGREILRRIAAMLTALSKSHAEGSASNT